MTDNSQVNPCIRCGKQRIVMSVHKEYVGGSLITTTQTSCPDPLCQRKLVEMLEKERRQREELVNRQYPFSRGRMPNKG